MAAVGNLSNVTAGPVPALLASRRYENNIAAAMGVLGVLFNGASLLVFASRKKLVGPISRIIILNQCAVDMLLGATLIYSQFHSIYISQYMPAAVQRYLEPWLYCKVLWSTVLLWFLIYLSASNIQLLSVERYISVCHPFVHRDITSLRMVLVLVVQFLLNLAFTMQYPPYFTYIPEGNVCAFAPPASALSTVYAVSHPLMYYVVPAVLSIVIYTRMFITLSNRVSGGGASGAEGGTDREKRKIRTFITTCCFMAGAYIFCFTGTSVLWFIANTGIARLDTQAFYYIVIILLVFANCFINPVIYITKMAAFRRALKSILGCGQCGKGADNMDNSQTG